MGPWGKAEDNDAGVGVSEAGDGFTPVVVVQVGTAFFAGDLFAVLDQARAKSTRDDFGIELYQPRRYRSGTGQAKILTAKYAKEGGKHAKKGLALAHLALQRTQVCGSGGFW